MNRGNAVFGRAMKTYSKASRTHRVSAAAFWPLDANRNQLFDSSGSAAVNSSNPSVCLEPTETSNRKKSTVGRRVRKTAKKSVVTVVSLKENCEPSEEPARRGKVVSGLRRNVQPDSETSSSNSTMSASCSEVEPKETSKRKKSSVGSRRIRATKRQAMEKAPSDSIPQTNEPASVALRRPAQFVTHRRGAASRIASIPLPNLDSTDEFVLKKGFSNGQMSRRCKARVTFTFSPESSVNDTVQSHRRSAIRRVCQQSSISEAEDQTVEPYHRKPLFCSTPSLQLVGKRPGVSAATPPVSPLDLSAPEELVPSGDHCYPPLSAPLREPGSGCKTLPIITEAPDMHETPRVMLFSDGSNSVSSYRSVSRESEMLIDALKDMCLSKQCQVQLERVNKLLPQTPYVSCLGYSSTDLCPQTTEEPQMVESGQAANHSDRLCPWPPCHVTDYSASLIDGQSVHPSELVTDTFNIFLSENSSQSVAQCDSDNKPSVTDIHTSSLAHSVEPSVTDVHTSSLAHSVEPSVTDIHTSSLAHSVEHSVTDIHTSSLAYSVEPSVTDVHTSSLAHSIEHSVTDIHTSSLAHSVECNQSVTSVQSAHQVDDNIESVTDAWPVDNSSYVVVDQQQFSKQVPEDKAAMIIARLKEECLAKKSTVPLKRLASTQWTGAHGHGMHSEHTASENGSTRSEAMTADAKECVQNPNECRPKKVSRTTKETKRRSASRDRPGTARKAFVSGLSVSRWRDRGSATADSFQTQHARRGRSKAGDSSITGHHNTSKVVNEGLLHGSIFSTPVRALPSHLDLSSLLANLTPETHTWSRLKARLSVHRRVTVRMTPRTLQSSVLESSGRAGQVDGSMDLFDMHVKTVSKWVQSRLQNSSTFLSICEGAEDDLSDAEKVYAECNQQGALCWEECILPERLKRCKKIGEGTFGEVFSTVDASGDTVALKIIPIEGKEKVNGEEQKTFGDILHEMIISKELSSLKEKQHNQTYGFIGLHGLHCVKGSYPAVMLKAWDAFDRQKRSENDRPDFFEDEQLFLILEYEFGGSDLENSNGKLSSLAVARSILHQVTAALAVAEQQLCFEHRDLHWGNILVKATKEKSTSFLLDGIEHYLETKGVLVRIIDYSLSRLEIDGLTVACDISEDEELFMGQGDYQFDIYRLMREQNSNKWDDYQPHSNVLWLHYLCTKLLSMKYRSKGGYRAKDTREELGRICDNLLQCRSATEALQSGLSTFGNAGNTHYDYPKDSGMMELFQCTKTQSNRYKMSLLKQSTKALALSSKASVRTDNRGFLSLQYLVRNDDGQICFVEYYCCPDEEADVPED